MKKLNVAKVGLVMTLLNAVLFTLGFVYLAQSQSF